MENDSELQKLYEDYVSQNIVITEKYNEYSKCTEPKKLNSIN